MKSVDNHSTLYAAQTNLASGDINIAPVYNALFNSHTPRKQARESSFSFLGDDISSQLLQHTQQVDQLILNYAEKVRAELMEHRRRCWMQTLAAAEDGVLKQLRAKEEDIDGIRKLNWALEEQIRSLSVEIETCWELAQNNEFNVEVLRNNLKQVLAAQVGADHAESSCCSNSHEEERRRAASKSAKRVCRSCGEREALVLLLPCRHLCLCSSCGPMVNECQVCKCRKEASLTVNIV